MDKLHALADALLEKETLDSKAIDAVLGMKHEAGKSPTKHEAAQA
jgi:ATP-dependent Zn protease